MGSATPEVSVAVEDSETLLQSLEKQPDKCPPSRRATLWEKYIFYSSQKNRMNESSLILLQKTHYFVRNKETNCPNIECHTSLILY